jgi:hypothetical protein
VMHRLVSALVLSLALSGATGSWLDHWTRSLAHRASCETASHGTSGWNDRDHQVPIPIVEALPGGTISVDRSTGIVRGMAAPSHGRHLTIVRTRIARPHDPPHLHPYALLI